MLEQVHADPFWWTEASELKPDTEQKPAMWGLKEEVPQGQEAARTKVTGAGTRVTMPKGQKVHWASSREERVGLDEARQWESCSQVLSRGWSNLSS